MIIKLCESVQKSASLKKQLNQQLIIGYTKKLDMPTKNVIIIVQNVIVGMLPLKKIRT